MILKGGTLRVECAEEFKRAPHNRTQAQHSDTPLFCRQALWFGQAWGHDRYPSRAGDDRRSLARVQPRLLRVPLRNGATTLLPLARSVGFSPAEENRARQQRVKQARRSETAAS
jgi:hypothetical protein